MRAHKELEHDASGFGLFEHDLVFSPDEVKKERIKLPLHGMAPALSRTLRRRHRDDDPIEIKG